MTTTPSARAREAAADLLRRHYPHEKGTERLAQAIEAGRADGILFVRAFARFEAAIRADQMKRDAGVADGIAREAANEVHSYDSYGGPALPGRDREVIRQQAADAIASAILAHMENSDEG